MTSSTESPYLRVNTVLASIRGSSLTNEDKASLIKSLEHLMVKSSKQRAENLFTDPNDHRFETEILVNFLATVVTQLVIAQSSNNTAQSTALSSLYQEVIGIVNCATPKVISSEPAEEVKEISPGLKL